MKHANLQKRLKEIAILLYRSGNSEAEILANKANHAEVRELGTDWDSIKQTSLNRWLRAAKDEDPDLEIWHILNRRWRKPGMYTNWEPNGLAFFGEYIPLGDPGPPVEAGPQWKVRLKLGKKYSLKDTDAVGIYIAELKSFGYSLREIVAIWGNQSSRHPTWDKSPRVKRLVRLIQDVRKEPMSYTTIRQILKTYTIGPIDEAINEVRMSDTREADEE